MKRLLGFGVLYIGLIGCNKKDIEKTTSFFSYKGGDYGLDLGLIEYTYNDSEELYTYNVLLTSTRYITYKDGELNGTGYMINFNGLTSTEFPISGTFEIPDDFRMLLYENNTYPGGNSDDAVINEFINGELNITINGDQYEIVFSGTDEINNDISLNYEGVFYIEEQS